MAKLTVKTLREALLGLPQDLEVVMIDGDYAYFDIAIIPDPEAGTVYIREAI